MEFKEMVEEFQCPGCVAGSDTRCGHYKTSGEWRRCVGHVLGTQLGLGNHVSLGLPNGFNKPGWEFPYKKEAVNRNTIEVRLWPKGEITEWDRLNVAVWAMEKDGFLFVRTYSPRINVGYVDVIEDGTIDLCPNAIDVSKFIDEID